jgi:VanZ family protein
LLVGIGDGSVRTKNSGRTRLIVWAWLPVVLYALAIFYFSSMSNPPTVGGVDFGKALHVLEYAGLGFLFLRAVEKGSRLPNRSTKVLLQLAFLSAFLYGFTDEVHQLFVPGRHFVVTDMFIDAFGGFVGGAAYVSIKSKLRRLP